MTKISRRSNFKSGTGHYYMILGIKNFKGKLRTRWLRPYVVERCHDNGSMQIKTIDEEAIPLLVNGHRLKM